ncbi:GNAT family N-acetyltransferase [Acinetobacter sp.]|uniref:GNAT family N-acetyltransferase n=1 Tax=Acinetobacter sp. TaxID=472 RepID=UPI003752FE06
MINKNAFFGWLDSKAKPDKDGHIEYGGSTTSGRKTDYDKFTPLHAYKHDKETAHIIGKAGDTKFMHAICALEDGAANPDRNRAYAALTFLPKYQRPTAEITGLYTHPIHRRKGYADSLIKYIKENHPNSTLIVEADPFKDAAVKKEDIHALYKKHGFIDVPDADGMLVYIPGREKKADVTDIIGQGWHKIEDELPSAQNRPKEPGALLLAKVKETLQPEEIKKIAVDSREVFKQRWQAMDFGHKDLNTIRDLYLQDQDERLSKSPSKDDERGRTARPIINKYIDTIKRDPNLRQSAWLLIQHMDKHPSYQKRMLNQFDISSQEYKYLSDRIAVNTGKPQTYNTQKVAELDRVLTKEDEPHYVNVNILRDGKQLSHYHKKDKIWGPLYGSLGIGTPVHKTVAKLLETQAGLKGKARELIWRGRQQNTHYFNAAFDKLKDTGKSKMKSKWEDITPDYKWMTGELQKKSEDAFAAIQQAIQWHKNMAAQGGMTNWTADPTKLTAAGMMQKHINTDGVCPLSDNFLQHHVAPGIHAGTQAPVIKPLPTPNGSGSVKRSQLLKQALELKLQQRPTADQVARKPSAAIVQGDQQFIKGNHRAKKFYEDIAEYIRNKGYSVQILKGKSTGEAPKATVVVSHGGLTPVKGIKILNIPQYPSPFITKSLLAALDKLVAKK